MWSHIVIHSTHEYLKQQSLRASLHHHAESQTAYAHMDARLYCALKQQHEPWTLTWSLVVLQTTGPSEEVQYSKWAIPHIVPLSLPRARGILLLGNGFRGHICICISSRMLHITLPTILGIVSMLISALFLSSVTTIMSLFLSLFNITGVAPFSIFPTSPLIFVHCSGTCSSGL